MNENKTFLSDWVSGKMTEEEVSQYITPEELNDYKIIIDYVDKLDVPGMDVEASYRKFLQCTGSRIEQAGQRTRGTVRRMYRYVAAASVILLIGIWTYFNTPVKVRTVAGEQKTVSLYDGTTVYMNALSELRYSRNPFSKRDVHLTGEAYFEVTKGDKFTVHTPQGEVQVLGTRFNVLSWTDYFEVECYEGHVKVRRSDNEENLTEGIAVRSSSGSPMRTISLPKQEKAPWLEGYRHFERTALKVVFQAIENQFGYRINAAGVDQDKTLTGNIPLDRLEHSMSILSSLLQVDYEIDRDKKTVLLVQAGSKNK